jgi:hypothetical protein
MSRSRSPRRSMRRAKDPMETVRLGDYAVNIVPRTNDMFPTAVNTIKTLLVKNVCRDQVRPGYVRDSLSPYAAVTHVAVLFANEDAKGFMTLVRTGHKLFIDVICADPGFGKPMILSVLKWADDNSITDVELHALPGVLFYYQQYGFNFRKSCNDGSFVFSPEERTEYLSQKIQFFNEAENNPIAIQYLKMLQQESLNIKKGPCKPDATLEEISRNKCSEDGFEMHRCAV